MFLLLWDLRSQADPGIIVEWLGVLGEAWPLKQTPGALVSSYASTSILVVCSRLCDLILSLKRAPRM